MVVYRTIGTLDASDTLSMFARVRALGPHPFWLDSGASFAKEHGRFWAMGAAPYAILTAPEGDPLLALETFATSVPTAPANSTYPVPAPLLVGTLSYEVGRFADRLPTPEHDPVGFPDIWWGRYGAVMVGDMAEKRLWCVGETDEAIDSLLHGLETVKPEPVGVASLASAPIPDMSDADYRAGVEEVLSYIGAGDVYQANIARRFEARLSEGTDPVAVFAFLRSTSEAPYSAYLDLGEHKVLSASPECLLSWNGQGQVSSFPIKGTRRRGDDPRSDASEREALRSDPKELAEHIMIVDLVRNDLGRVAEPGSVHVAVPWAIETFPGLHHLVSEVQATVSPDTSLADLIRAVFPGGSITGAPKVRACEIIAEIERSRRGIYCGAIGYIEPGGGGCLNIPIRTGTIRGDRLFFHAGGGIVADSDPHREQAEVNLKSAAWSRLDCV